MQSIAIGLAAVGATLAVGVAGALHVTGSGQDPEMSATAARSQSPPATSPPTDPSAAGSAARAARGVPDPKEEGAVGEMAVGAIPGVGDLMMSRIPAATRQVIVVTGADASATVNRVVRWQRAAADAPWTAVGAEIAGRNGANGWTHAHVEGDRSSPVGVFSLTAAGGRHPDPGTALPYEFRPSFYQAGSHAGDPMAEAFNYVVAIDYNRLPGHPPSDPTRPLGAGAGGDIWLHVDHNTPTRGCISLPQASMEAVLHWLTPSSQPMIIMGDRASIEATAG
ncbi:L,D-transpeptidase family protein [Parafrankia elaeagni]|uniref:L,D-transpeptidase family protein n=1 Tax=Parafrankia elaeagni TaxID=222534 RepID=UPI0003632677|nr:L,D-transpeptidase family protein [Parafrankia elaeagni]